MTVNGNFIIIGIELNTIFGYNVCMDVIGIFGGAFNPPHKEHIRICRGLIDEFCIKKICFVPTKDAPHKVVDTPLDKRSDLISLAIQNDSTLCIDKIEQNFEGKTYSVNVLLALKQKYRDIVFIIGGDSMENFSSWERPDDIIKICPIIVVPRGDVTDKLTQAVGQYNNKGASITIADTIGEKVSSSYIRALVAFGLDTSEYLCEECGEYIERHALYRDYDPMIEKLKKRISADRYQHTVDTVLTALKLNDVWGVPSDKVFVATLLHDCMKDVDFVHKGVPEDTFGTLVMHAFNGAMEAKINYGIEDEDILNAIRYHTTCRPQMSKLEKLVYLADMIEPSRVYPDLDAIRQIAYRDAEQGFLAAFGSAYKHINNSIKNIYPLTIDAYKYYFKGENS